MGDPPQKNGLLAGSQDHSRLSELLRISQVPDFLLTFRSNR